MDITKVFDFSMTHVIADGGDAIEKIASTVIPQSVADKLTDGVKGRLDTTNIAGSGTQTAFLKLGSAADIVDGSRRITAWLGNPQWVKVATAGDGEAAHALLAAYIGATTLELAWQSSGMGTRDKAKNLTAAFKDDLVACGIVLAGRGGGVKAGPRLKALLPEMRDSLATLRKAFPPYIAPETEPATTSSEPKRTRVYCVAECDMNDAHITMLTSHLPTSQSSQTGIRCSEHDRIMSKDIVTE